MSPNLDIRMDRIESFCKRWKIVELSLFGSVIGRNFRSDSDVDVLLSFADDARWDPFDLVEMREELKDIFGREIDLVEKGTIRNPFRRHSIMTTKEVLYAA